MKDLEGLFFYKHYWGDFPKIAVFNRTSSCRNWIIEHKEVKPDSVLVFLGTVVPAQKVIGSLIYHGLNMEETYKDVEAPVKLYIKKEDIEEMICKTTKGPEAQLTAARAAS